MNTHLFFDLLHAQDKLDSWKLDYDSIIPDGSLGQFTPQKFANKHHAKKQN
ncbi:MAG: hypothetical protein ACK5LH_03125 [Akkermansiaceae bacterium]